MTSPLLAEPGFNPYLEQLAAQITQTQVANPGQLEAAKSVRQNWGELVIQAFSLSVDNVISNGTLFMAIAYSLASAGITLPIPNAQIPKALLRKTLEAVAAQNAVAAAHLITLRLGYAAMTDGPSDALAQYAADSLSPQVAGVDFSINVSAMKAHAWMDFLDEDTAAAIAKNTPFDEYDSRENAEICLMRTIRALNFESVQSLETQYALVKRVVVPWIRKLLKAGDYSTALQLEGLLFEHYVRRREDEKHYQDAYRLWAKMMEDAGREANASLPALVPAQHDKPAVGFFIHRASMLAHIQVLHSTLKGIKDIPALPYRMILYVWSDYDEAMERAFEPLGVRIIWLQQTHSINMPFYNRLLALRETMQKDGVQTLVWMCLMHMKGFALGLKLAPRQIYWSVKYQVGAFETPDDRIVYHDTGGKSVSIDGKDWKSVPMVFSSMQDTLNKEKLLSLRESFSQWDIILGTMAREDILNSESFLQTVACILKNNPRAVYFYTGRENLSSIQSVFKNAGVENQTRFVGWVDTVTYANLVDIYLDSWPARSGMTAFNVFEAGKPMVSLVLEDGGAIHTQMLSVLFDRHDDGVHFVLPAIDAAFDTTDHGKRFFPVVGNIDAYVAAAQKLIDDKTLREKTGAAFQNFAKHLVSAERAGQSLDTILCENLKAAGAL